MCGIVGFTNFKGNGEFCELRNKEIIENMKSTLSRRGPDEEGTYISATSCLGHRRLIVIDPDNGQQPMKCTYNNCNYVITYNGQLYNTDELRNQLIENGFSFTGHSDTEVLLKAYVFWGSNVVYKLNGIFAFAIWNESKKELFLARDHFGVKPLYYSLVNDTFVFASEIKALFEYPGIEPKLDKTSIQELIGIGPAHTPGLGMFKDIYEIKPAHFAIFNEYGLHIERYWKLKSKPHTDSFGKTCETVRYLLEDSIKRQLVSDVPLCTFLSGGLDSSIITLYASNHCKECNLGPLHTYSVDYVDNDKNFHITDFQPNSDNYYINLMNKKLGTVHENIVLSII